MKKIGLTTTVPVEVIYASGNIPIDLNNILVNGDLEKYIGIAEKAGFPRSLCAWIKGIYGVCLVEGVSEIIGVHEGDCSNTNSLLEILKLNGVKIVNFGYPKSHKLSDVKRNIKEFMNAYEVNLLEVESLRERLNIIREKVKELDELTVEGRVSSWDNHLFQVSCSDFWGNPNKFEEELEKKLSEARSKKPSKKILKLAYLGVPPIMNDLYSYIEERGAKVVFNEVQREFAFPRHVKAKNIFEQYGKGSNINNLSATLNNIKIPLPPLDIQEQIVNECQKVDDEIQKANKTVEQTKKEIEYEINSISGDMVKLEKIILINTETFDPTSRQNDNFIYVDIDSVGKADGSISYENIILGKDAPSRARRIVKNDSVVISTVRPYLKGFAYVEKQTPNCIFSTGFAVIQGKEKLSSKYLFLLFMFSNLLMKQMEEAMPKSSYPSINKKDIENFKIPLPSLETQKEIVSRIEKLEKNISDAKKIIDTAKDKKEEILKKYL